MRMPNAISIFIAGITGVFCGMLLLYASIKMTAIVVDRLEGAGKEKK